jgi:hypothetical protein
MAIADENSSTPKPAEASSSLTPQGIIERAERANPLFKLLWGILALAAVVCIVAGMLQLTLAFFGCLIVFLFLMVMSVTIGMNEPAGQETPARAQTQTMRLFLAWASSVLILLAVLALFSSAFFDWPVRGLQSRIFDSKPAIAKPLGPEASELQWHPAATLVKDVSLDRVKQALDGKRINDGRIRTVFVDMEAKIVQVDMAMDDKGKTIALKVSVVLGTQPFHLYDLKVEHPDFTQVRDALGLS